MATKLQAAKKRQTKAKELLSIATQFAKEAQTPEAKIETGDEVKRAQAGYDEATKAVSDLEGNHVAKASNEQTKTKVAKDKNEPTTEPDAGAVIKTITVVASEKRRRAGINFPKGQKVTVVLSDLDDDQILAIRNDPILSIQ